MSSEGNHQFCRSMLTATSEVQCQTLKSPMTNTWKVVRKVYTDCSSEVGYLSDYMRLTAQVAQVVKGPPSNAGAAGGKGSIPGLGRSLEEEMATGSRILAWEIPRTEKPGGLQSTGSQRVGHDWSNLGCTHLYFIYLFNSVIIAKFLFI